MAEIEAEIREAIILHVEGLREDGMPVPVAAGQVNYLDIAARPVPVHDSGNAQHPAPGDTASQRGRARALVTEE